MTFEQIMGCVAAIALLLPFIAPFILPLIEKLIELSRQKQIEKNPLILDKEKLDAERKRLEIQCEKQDKKEKELFSKHLELESQRKTLAWHRYEVDKAKTFYDEIKQQCVKQFNLEPLYDSVLNGRLINAFESNLSIENLRAVADINSGDHHYQNVTLTGCTCMDYQTRHIPCKHMLFLAHHLGILRSDRDYLERALQKANDKVKEVKSIEKNNKQRDESFKKKLDKAQKDLDNRYQQVIAKHDEAVAFEEEATKRLVQLKNESLKSVDEYVKLKCGSYPQLAGVMADFMTFRYEESIRILTQKSRPALGEVARIKELKVETKNIIKKEKQLEYKLAYIEKLFPNINDIFDDDFNEQDHFELETEENTDRTRLFLSAEEYRKLSITERNQLALDRYLSGRKSKWQVGRDYEMYIGYCLESRDYFVKYNGIIENLEDMGRDLIATKDKYVYIVQCKNWSQEKTIHEKHIFQLYGTVILYKLENPFFEVNGVFVTTTELSQKAKDVAAELGIQVHENVALKEFPRIKCNINRTTGERIYHLPFDQQYDTTVIELNDGECYALTVAEAEEKGFRRALKHFMN